MPQKYAVIVAGGSGSRMGGGVPKQFRMLKGRPVLWWSMKAFHNEDPDTKIIVVIPESHLATWNKKISALPSTDRIEHSVVFGGNSRTESVLNGLSQVFLMSGKLNKEKESDSLVAVHDGARPLVSTSMIAKGWETAEKKGVAIPVVPVTDSLRELEIDHSHSVDRSKYVAVQTPQVYRTSLLLKAYEAAGNKTFTDDASVVEAAGYPVYLYEGSYSNLKITNPEDMAIAKMIINKNV